MSGAGSASGALHQVVVASAGTGKTFRLSGRYLALVAAGQPTESILGSTFTRKAAGEILDRILGRLALAACDDGALQELNDSIAGALPTTVPALSRDRCAELLAGVARNIDRVQVRTLDSLFVQLGKVLGLELGLPPDWQLVDEAEDAALRHEAVARVLADSSTEQMADRLANLYGRQVRRRVHDALLEALQDDHAVFLESLPGAWERLVPPKALSPEALQARMEELRTVELPSNKDGLENKPWSKARDKLLGCAVDQDWDRLLCKDGLVGKVLDEAETYHRHPIAPAVRDVAKALARHAGHHVLSRWARVSAARYRMLERYDQVLQACRRERGAYTFGDLPRLLAPEATGAGSGAPRAGQLLYRLGAHINHLLLDEFQDTSVLQWRVLRPLVERIVQDDSGDRTFFCVGDTKQSIYSWRSGEPRLLTGLLDEYPALRRSDLSASWRSAQVVLDTVHRVFGRLERLAPVADDPVLTRAARSFLATYHEQRAQRSHAGEAVLWQVDTGDARAEEARQALVRAAAAHVAELVRQAPGRSIGVLFRTGKPIHQMLHELQQRHGIRASGEVGNALTDSDAVRVALSLLHFADHPSDSLAWFHVATSPLAGHLGAVPENATDVHGETAQQIARRLRRRLMEQGYGNVLTGLQDGVREAEAFGPWDRLRFGQLVDLAFAWDARVTLRPSDFVAMVRKRRVEDPTAAPVKVMTVHASKGLEFDAVVLAELDVPLAGGGRERHYYERPDPQGPVTKVFPAVNERCRAVSPKLTELFESHQARILEEALCLLYVAMTRAARRLDLFVSSQSGRSGSLTFARILRAALVPGDDGPDERGVLWRERSGAGPWHGASPEGGRVGPAGEPTALAGETSRACIGPIQLAPATRPRHLPRRSPSSLEGGSKLRARDLLRLGGQRARVRGLVLHGWFEQIEWLETFAGSEEAGDDALHAVAARLAQAQGLRIRPEDQRKWLGEFRRMLDQSATRGVLLKGDAAGQESQVWRERSFRVLATGDDGGDVLVAGTFDRVVLRFDGGRPAGAEIIDFKTDAKVDTEHYRPQMEEYRRVLAGLTALEPGAIRCRLLFVSADEVRDV